MNENEAVAGSHLLKVKEVADILALNTGTVYSWIRSGQIPSVKLGTKSIRVDSLELERWIDSRAVAEKNGKDIGVSVG